MIDPTETTTNMSTFRNVVEMLKQEETDLLVRKQMDYGPHNIAACPAGPVVGLIVRLFDKLARLQHLHDTGVLNDPQNEAAIDTARDIANYGTILSMVIAGVWPTLDTPEAVHELIEELNFEPDPTIYMDINPSEDRRPPLNSAADMAVAEGVTS